MNPGITSSGINFNQLGIEAFTPTSWKDNFEAKVEDKSLSQGALDSYNKESPHHEHLSENYNLENKIKEVEYLGYFPSKIEKDGKIQNYCLNVLSNLVEEYNKNNDKKIALHIDAQIMNKFGDKTIDNSYWASATKMQLYCRRQPYHICEKLAGHFDSSYRALNVLEAVTLAVMRAVSGKERMFTKPGSTGAIVTSDKLQNEADTEEEIKSHYTKRIVVQTANEGGIRVTSCDYGSPINAEVAAVRIVG